MLCLHLPVVTSQRRTLWSRLQLATKLPESWKATPQTACVWSLYVATHFCFSKLHSLTVESPAPDARCVPCKPAVCRVARLLHQCWEACCTLSDSRHAQLCCVSWAGLQLTYTQG